MDSQPLVTAEYKNMSDEDVKDAKLSSSDEEIARAAEQNNRQYRTDRVCAMFSFPLGPDQVLPEYGNLFFVHFLLNDEVYYCAIFLEKYPYYCMEVSALGKIAPNDWDGLMSIWQVTSNKYRRVLTTCFFDSRLDIGKCPVPQGLHKIDFNVEKAMRTLLDIFSSYNTKTGLGVSPTLTTSDTNMFHPVNKLVEEMKAYNVDPAAPVGGYLSSFALCLESTREYKLQQSQHSCVIF